MGAGDNLIDAMIEQGIAATKDAATPTQGVCPAHEPIRTGVYALLLDAQDRRKNGLPIPTNGEANGKSAGFFGSAIDVTTATGAKVHTTVAAVLFLGVVYLIARAHGINLP